MLVLSRRLREKILFPGIGAVVQVMAVKGGLVRLGIEAPPEVTILREEVQGVVFRGQPSGPEVDRGPDWDGFLEAVSAGLGLARLHLEAGNTRRAEAVLKETQLNVLRLRRRLRKDRRQPSPPPGHRGPVPVRDEMAETAG